jgi:hypothetical protein
MGEVSYRTTRMATFAKLSDLAFAVRRKCCDMRPTFSVDLIDKR